MAEDGQGKGKPLHSRLQGTPEVSNLGRVGNCVTFADIMDIVSQEPAGGKAGHFRSSSCDIPAIINNLEKDTKVGTWNVTTVLRAGNLED